eukprot:SAG11_NODE_575_length_8420_cov_2.398149_1_plen_38_part_00
MDDDPKYIGTRVDTHATTLLCASGQSCTLEMNFFEAS